MDVVLLSRIQFALTIMFHYLFPPLTIGLGWIMVATEAMYLRAGDRQYETITRFWTKLFAVNFAVGVATGIVMEFQFGTNWSAYSRFVGDVFGSALAAEGIFAFFLESGFLAVLVFGWDRVSPKMHFFATLMVALGSTFSAIWIVVANSWQQTPAGYHIVETEQGARAEITNFWAVVFNPSSMDRLLHVILGALILGAFFVLSISAYYYLQGKHQDFARKTIGVALVFGLVVALAQVVSGDRSANIVATHQPEKLAAMEGLYTTPEGGAPLHIWGFPDSEARVVRAGIAIPGMLSFLVHRDFTKPVPGLDQFPLQNHPPVPLPFYSFHLMVGLGMFMITVLALGLWFQRAGTLYQQRWYLWLLVGSVVAPYAANQLGWAAAEVGRQPWAVYGLLRTADGVSRSVPGEQVAMSIALFGLIYLCLFAVWVYVMNDKIHHGPEPVELPRETPEAGGLLDVAARYSDPASRYSMTEAHDEAPPPGEQPKTAEDEPPVGEGPASEGQPGAAPAAGDPSKE